MPKGHDRVADERTEPSREWKPTFPPGRYLSDEDSAIMLWAVADIMAHGTESVWHGVVSWEKAVREGIREWFGKQRREIRGEVR